MVILTDSSLVLYENTPRQVSFNATAFYDATVTRDPEVLQDHVTGEDVRRGELLDRVAPVDHRLLALVVGHPAEIEIERRDPATDVDVLHHHPVVLDAHGATGLA